MFKFILRKKAILHSTILFIVGVFIVLAFAPYAYANVDFSWAKKIGGTSVDYGYSIAVDSSGNVYTTGLFYGTVDFDPGAGTSNLVSTGDADIFISKLDSSGNFVWAKKMGSGGYDSGNSITVDSSGNVYTTGMFLSTGDFDPGAGTFNLTSSGNHDIFVSKLDSNGDFVWAKSMGASVNNDVGNSIKVDSSGNVYTTGLFYGTADFDPGAGTYNLAATASSSDIFISKLDSSGNFVWAKAFVGSTVTDYGNSITVDSSGNVYTTGTFVNTVDFDPGAGTSYLTSYGSGNMDSFISKLDSSGNFVWAKKLSGTSTDWAKSITLDSSSNIYITGYFYGTLDADPGAGTSNLTSSAADDMFVIKFNSNGELIWAKRMGSTGSQSGNSISVDSSGNVYTTGIFANTVDFDPGAGTFNLASAGTDDIFISKLDSSGNFVWAGKLGSTGSDYGNGIFLDSSGNPHITGYFAGTVDADPGAGTSNLISAGNSDIFILKMSIDTTAPTISEVTPVTTPTNDTTPNYTFTTNEGGSITYGGSCSSATTTATVGSNTITFNSLPADTYSNCTITVTDASSNVSSQLSVSSFVIDTTAPGIIQFGATPSNTTAVVTWETSENTSSIVDYGITNSYETSTVESDTSPRVTSHTVNLSSLVPCTTYFFQVRSRDAALNSVVNQSVFTTLGCIGDASIVSSTLGLILDSTGGTKELVTGVDKSINLSIPAGTVNDDASFQIKQLDQTSALLVTGTPSGAIASSSHVYDLKALTDANTAITSFNDQITITLSYLDEDVVGIVESSLLIYRWDGVTWNSLSGCVVDTTLNNITCTTTNFSVFSLFGTPIPSPSSSVVNGAVNVAFLQELSDRLRKESSSNNVVTVKKEEKKEEKKCGILSDNPKILKLNTKHINVKTLQQILNCKGYIISTSGAGSPGKETTLFGSKTRQAVIRFQKDNGLKADGVLGSLSRKILSE